MMCILYKMFLKGSLLPLGLLLGPISDREERYDTYSVV